MKIISNNHWHNFLYGYELPESVRADFDYLDDISEGTFLKYRGRYYDLSEFSAISGTIAPHPQRPGWGNYDAYMSDSFFSGVLLKLSDDNEQYQIATFIN